MSAIISFLGSAIFRYLLEKIFNIVERKQDHSQEVELMKLQADIEIQQHSRRLEILEKTNKLENEKLQIIGDQELEELDSKAFIQSIKNAKSTGNKWIDGWNGIIRPLVATIAIIIWLGLLVYLVPIYVSLLNNLDLALIGKDMIDFTLNLISVALGWYFASRGLMPNKK